MDADWYVDPLERFDGRYFDGTTWTDQVSRNGKLAIDPDWPPVQGAAKGNTPAAATDLAVDAADPEPAAPEPDPEPTASDPEPAAPEPDPEPTASDPEPAAPEPDPEAPTPDPEPAAPEVARPEVPAVESIAPSAIPRQATLTEESPARPVAVLTGSDERSGIDGERRRRWPLIVGLVVMLAVLALIAIALFGGDDTPNAELEVDAPEGIVDSATQFEASERVEVGKLTIINGASLLADLEDWHKGYAEERGVDLPDGASCWFGRLGDAAIPSAQCGPVGGSADTDFLFDKVPVIFDNATGGQLAQPVVDATEIDQLLPNSLELIGSNDGPEPPEGASTIRGERNGG